MPTLTYNQINKNQFQPQNIHNQMEKTNPPVIPPRPVRHVLNPTQQSIKTSRAPPPPLPIQPTELPNQTQNLSIPIPPPPPPPPLLLPPAVTPMFSSEQTTDEKPIVPSNSEHNSLLKEICNFDTIRLKACIQIFISLI